MKKKINIEAVEVVKEKIDRKYIREDNSYARELMWEYKFNLHEGKLMLKVLRKTLFFSKSPTNNLKK